MRTALRSTIPLQRKLANLKNAQRLMGHSIDIAANLPKAAFLSCLATASILAVTCSPSSTGLLQFDPPIGNMI
jgi:hypothetical protein